ncbi:SDR family NAD(P)-dependent oxidoreductase, partial [Streptomyces sp. NPDC020917]|uniref:SDR family NAD(P)-dependent oxidoreductase n=1 Tax=Streptomyces sp. NPDC020917 TaxID=3365102 RepID=UPI0037953F23
AITHLHTQGTTHYIEIGPDTTLTTLNTHTLTNTEPAPTLTHTLHPKHTSTHTLTTALATLHVNGAGVDWDTVTPRGPRVDLPTYAFQQQRHWLDEAAATAVAGGARTGEKPEQGIVDSAFWTLVEQEDAATLARELEVTDAQPLHALLPSLVAWRKRRQEAARVDGWRYRIAWRPLVAPPGPRLSGTWLLVVPAGPAAADAAVPVAAALRRRGAAVVEWTVDAAAADRTALADRLRGLSGGEGRIDGVLSLLPLDGTPHPRYAAVPSGLGATLALVQAMADAGAAGPLWNVTAGAVLTGHDDAAVQPGQAQVWGFGRSVALERSKQWGGLIDLPAEVTEQVADRLAGALAAGGDEDQIAVRPGGGYGRRLVRAAPAGTGTGTAGGAADAAPRPPGRPRGTVLVTGGTGGISAHVARRLAREGAEHLLLTSRRGPDAPGAAELAAELEALGARVTVAACDVADRAATAALLASVPDDVPLTAVVHAAGVAQQFTDVCETGLADVQRVTAGKVRGAAVLDELLAGTELDAFVLFSSNSALWGSGGNAAYAAGNAYLDALAERRRARGEVATSLAWGTWGGGGMLETEDVGDYMDRRGILEMAPESAVGALMRAVGDDETALGVTAIDWSRFVLGFTSSRPSPLLHEIAEAQQALQATGSDDTADPDAFAERLLALPRYEQTGFLVDFVRTEVAAVLRHTGSDGVSADRSFKELGFDSLTAVELRNRLNAATGLRLPAGLVFDHPTPELLARHLLDEIVPQGPDEGGSAGVLAELASLEASVAALTGAGAGGGAAGGSGGAAVPAGVAERLEAMAWKLRRGQGGGGGNSRSSSSEDEPAGDDLALASSAEIFDLIDRELGLS